MIRNTIDNLIYQIYESRSLMGQKSAQAAAARIRLLLKEKGSVNIIFAAAPSQNEFLENLVKEKDIDWTRIRAFHMDEYVALDKDAPQGFGNFLYERIFSKLPFMSVSYINGNAPDPEAECLRYAGLLKEFPADIVLMGIGENGHIAFNDPHVAKFDDPKMVKVVDLDDKCRQQQVNDGCFATFDDVPEKAFTLTIPTLMRATYAFCMVPGKTKAHAVADTIQGEITEKVPATILRKHPHAILFLDPDSSSEMK